MKDILHNLQRFLCSICAFVRILRRGAVIATTTLILMLAAAAHAQTIVRVDGNASNNYPQNTPPGATWADSFKFLQDGIDYAKDHTPSQIWVRGSSNPADTWRVYYPDRDHNHPTGTSNPVNRAATFMLHDDVIILGGFHGGVNGETDKNERNYLANVTILSGEIGTANDLSDNSYHVVSCDHAAGSLTSAWIDGFTITRGNAVGSSAPSNSCAQAEAGGGMIDYSTDSLVLSASPIITRCKFEDNHATYGGAYYHGPTGSFGNVRPMFYMCQFISNAADEGGAVYVTVSANCSPYSPVIFQAADFYSCLFDKNEAEDHGGAIWLVNTVNIAINNCTIVRNVAGNEGGGLYTDSNTCEEGAAFDVTNSILWINECGSCQSGTEATQIYGNRLLLNSCLQYMQASDCHIDCISDDPEFVNDTDPNPDFHLTSESTAIDGGLSSTAYVVYDTYNLNQDNTLTGTSDRSPDLDGLVRIVGHYPNCDLPDMGAYEFDSHCVGDVTDDGFVNVSDLLAVINGWNGSSAQIYLPCFDGTVGVNDLLAVINNWGIGCLAGAGRSAGSLTSVQDCMDAATNEGLTPYSQEWDNFVEKCVQGLCEAHIINCD